MSLVVDASMTMAWLFDEGRGDAPEKVLRKVAAEGANVPSLWRLEVANSLRNAIRRQRCDAAYAAQCLQRLHQMWITVDAETDARAWGPTRQLADDHDLTLYDAAYLELALRRARPLASCDETLIKAGRQAGLEVLAG
ncbi:MAG TPA: type II toxin-antitoxin system VapC family toxin [Stellaceae bacterium]|nr:type II toxin-antitoxin system VapC family toxin [Stellaceae bacterium]